MSQDDVQIVTQIVSQDLVEHRESLFAGFPSCFIAKHEGVAETPILVIGQVGCRRFEDSPPVFGLDLDCVRFGQVVDRHPAEFCDIGTNGGSSCRPKIILDSPIDLHDPPVEVCDDDYVL